MHPKTGHQNHAVRALSTEQFCLVWSDMTESKSLHTCWVLQVSHSLGSSSWLHGWKTTCLVIYGYLGSHCPPNFRGCHPRPRRWPMMIFAGVYQTGMSFVRAEASKPTSQQATYLFSINIASLLCLVLALVALALQSSSTPHVHTMVEALHSKLHAVFGCLPPRMRAGRPPKAGLVSQARPVSVRWPPSRAYPLADGFWVLFLFLSRVGCCYISFLTWSHPKHRSTP